IRPRGRMLSFPASAPLTRMRNGFANIYAKKRVLPWFLARRAGSALAPAATCASALLLHEGYFRMRLIGSSLLYLACLERSERSLPSEKYFGAFVLSRGN